MGAMFSSFSDTMSDKIGNLSSLATTDKSSVVGAINEVNGKTNITTISGTGSYGCTYYATKSGHVVNLKVSNITNATIGQDILLCNLPEEYRPKLFEQYVRGSYSVNSIYEQDAVAFKIRLNGNVETHSYKAFDLGVFTCTYIVD